MLCVPFCLTCSVRPLQQDSLGKFCFLRRNPISTYSFDMRRRAYIRVDRFCTVRFDINNYSVYFSISFKRKYNLTRILSPFDGYINRNFLVYSVCIVGIFDSTLFISVELRLLVEHFRIDSAFCVQFGVRAVFCYAAVAENSDVICELNRR